MESLKGQLHVADSNAKSFEALANERAHQISMLEKESKGREERLGALEEALGSRDSKIRELEVKMATDREKISALQVEKERLIQQVSNACISKQHQLSNLFLLSCRLILSSASSRRVMQRWLVHREGSTCCWSLCVATSTRLVGSRRR